MINYLLFYDNFLKYLLFILDFHFYVNFRFFIPWVYPDLNYQLNDWLLAKKIICFFSNVQQACVVTYLNWSSIYLGLFLAKFFPPFLNSIVYFKLFIYTILIQFQSTRPTLRLSYQTRSSSINCCWLLTIIHDSIMTLRMHSRFIW